MFSYRRSRCFSTMTLYDLLSVSRSILTTVSHVDSKTFTLSSVARLSATHPQTVQHVGLMHRLFSCVNHPLPHNGTPDICQYTELNRDCQRRCWKSWSRSEIASDWRSIGEYSWLICGHGGNQRESGRRKFEDGQRQSHFQGGEDFLDSLGEYQKSSLGYVRGSEVWM